MDLKLLGKCEQFFLELLRVPRIEQKLNVFAFKLAFDEQSKNTKQSLTLVNNACKEVRVMVLLLVDISRLFVPWKERFQGGYCTFSAVPDRNAYEVCVAGQDGVKTTLFDLVLYGATSLPYVCTHCRSRIRSACVESCRPSCRSETPLTRARREVRERGGEGVRGVPSTRAQREVGECAACSHPCSAVRFKPDTQAMLIVANIALHQTLMITS